MMSSFDAMNSSMTESMTTSFIDPVNKLPLRRLEPTIHRFTKIALPTDLERLAQHKKIIKRYKEQKDWEKLNIEQINARLTVQQLKANLREMDKARCQILDEDLAELDGRVNPLKNQALEAIASFLQECGMEVLSDTGATNNIINSTDADVRQRPLPGSTEENETINCEDQSQMADTNERLRQRLEETKHVEETWKKLQGDLEDVSSIIQDFAQQVQQQKEMTDRIEDNVSTAQTSALQGAKDIIRTSKLKNVLLPLTGAIVGTVVGGPLGLMVGYKVGAIAAFGGGAVGLLSARVFKMRADKENNSELEKLEEEQKMLDDSDKDVTDR